MTEPSVYERIRKAIDDARAQMAQTSTIVVPEDFEYDFDYGFNVVRSPYLDPGQVLVIPPVVMYRPTDSG